MAPALLFDENGTSSPASESSISSSAMDEAPALTISQNRRSRRNRNSLRSPLLKRSARGPPLILEEAKGNWLSVSDETKAWRIFDASGGAAVSNIGHKDQRVYDAIRQQEETGVGYAASMSFQTEVAEDFADFLLESTDDKMTEVVFYGSGSEANEAAQKLAYQYHSKLKDNPQPQRRWFIARDRSYHGATLGALEGSGHKGRKDMYKPILPEKTQFISPCNPCRDMIKGETTAQYVKRLQDELERKILDLGPETVAGFVMEPVVGAALGCVPALPGYLSAMKSVCKKYGVLFILDEVMSGMGRTGYMHAWQDEDVVPDIQLVGKGLAGGYAAISAMLVGPVITDALGEAAFAHGHTFQNFPAACAAGLAVQHIVRDDNLLENVRDKGDKLMKKLMTRLSDHPNVFDIRGKGLFLGIEFVQDKKTKAPFDPEVAVAWRVHELGMFVLLLRVIHRLTTTSGLKDGYNVYMYPGSGTVDGNRGDHVIIAPAYNITDTDVEFIVDRVSKTVFDFFEELSIAPKL
ncbi:PLP-dependent transferase [Alternaria alternata]|uniref:PLP-dependent transferase n=1 Tax=Alternaria alternata TaxID=5599 RepID=A0A177DYV2_ALTAL|nr:PLP-dependent transferase [Alternaria alternata]OAG24162.1 PLP-dependent transferase [Alternaria alternata]